MAALLKLAEVYDARFNEVRQLAYLEALESIKAVVLEFAVKEAIKREEFFPAPAKLIEYAGCYRPPVLSGDLSRPAIPEDCTPPEVAVRRLKEISAILNGSYGTNFQVDADRPVLRVVK